MNNKEQSKAKHTENYYKQIRAKHTVTITKQKKHKVNRHQSDKVLQARMQATGTKQASSAKQATSTKQTTSIQTFKSTYKLVLVRKLSTNETTKIHNSMCLVVKMCTAGLCSATSDLPPVSLGVPTNLVTSQVSERMHEIQRNFKLVPSRPSTKETYGNTTF